LGLASFARAKPGFGEWWPARSTRAGSADLGQSLEFGLKISNLTYSSFYAKVSRPVIFGHPDLNRSHRIGGLLKTIQGSPSSEERR
jgi:hypothetical protein